MAKAMAFIVLLSAVVSAACLSMLCYTYVTGDLPFNMVPLIQPQLNRTFGRQPEKNAARLDTSKERISEEFLYSYYRELSGEREKIASEQEKLAEKQRNVNEILTQAKMMQDKILASEKRVKSILDFIDDKQQENLRKTAKMLSGMDTAAAGKLLLEWEDKKAAQILYFVPDKQVSKIVNEIMQGNKKDDIAKIDKIVTLMESISEKPERF